jgi:phosphate butyryltransferase
LVFVFNSQTCSFHPNQNKNMITKLSDLHEKASSHKKKKLVLAAAHDQNALEAVLNASAKGIIDVILVGDRSKIDEIACLHHYDLSGFELIHTPDNEYAAEMSVKLVSEKKADILMKGHLGTSCLLKAVLNKEWGLRSGEMLSHLALFELPSYHKLLAITDAAMNIAPDLKAKVSIIKNSVAYIRKLGIENPKVAILSAVEVVNPDLQSSMDAAVLAKMGERKQIDHCIIDGPLAFDNAISRKSAETKCILSPVAGDADLLVCHDLDTANVLYKSLVYFAQARCAAVITGAAAPIVLTSRADSDDTKLNSIALAAAF